MQTKKLEKGLGAGNHRKLLDLTYELAIKLASGKFGEDATKSNVKKLGALSGVLSCGVSTAKVVLAAERSASIKAIELVS